MPIWVSFVHVYSHASPAVDITPLVECDTLSFHLCQTLFHFIFRRSVEFGCSTASSIWEPIYDQILAFYDIPNESTGGDLIKEQPIHSCWATMHISLSFLFYIRCNQ